MLYTLPRTRFLEQYFDAILRFIADYKAFTQ